MTHLIVLLMVVGVGSADGVSPDLSWAPGWARDFIEMCRAHVLPITLIGFGVIIVALMILIVFCERRLSRTGRAVWVRIADRGLLLGQWSCALWLGFACYALGWLAFIRERVGDLILIDELLALLPGVVALAALWAAFWPVERRLREATHFGRLESGEPVHEIPSRWQFLSDQLRTHAGPTLIAALLLFAWIETVDLIAVRFHDRLGEHADTIATLGLGLGAIAIVGVLPVLWKMIWRTRRLPPGELRDELHALCARHKVRVADLLIWETRGALLNGALVGVLPRLRYIMLTDALLERLSAREVEAVMAHEIAHARHRHIPWLIGTVLVVVGLVSSLATLALGRVAGVPEGWAHAIGGGLAIVGAILVLGWVSRRFEEQADAFAVQHLAAVRSGTKNTPIDEQDASGMAGALGAVARFNHIPVAKFSFRHGSIRSRQRRLMGLIGAPTGSVAIDGSVRWLKRVVLVCALVLVVLLWKVPEAGALL